MVNLTTYAVGFLGEQPELPPDVVQFLHERAARVGEAVRTQR